tara:strand:+ start:315 stop:1046 length:732 start_codon:yes stop_codon:yes gene_type:complete
LIGLNYKINNTWKLKTFCYIFARGGSKGLPKKNIKPLLNKPLISYSIDIAKEISEIDKLFVSTDSAEIANISESKGAIIINRPKEISGDNSPEWLAWKHAINWTYDNYGTFTKFLSLPSTSPLRSKNDVIKCLNSFKSEKDVIITMTESSRNPWFNMVKMNGNKSIDLVLKSKNKISRRQDAPTVFDLTTVAYVLNPNFILNYNSIWDGKVKGVFIPKKRAIDIDDEFDFKIAEMIMGDKNNG